jgi:hypothetical protein
MGRDLWSVVSGQWSVVSLKSLQPDACTLSAVEQLVFGGDLWRKLIPGHWPLITSH